MLFVLPADTPETAYLYALSASGVVHSLTSACTAGSLPEYCQCRDQYSTTPQGNWKWGGCGDDIRFGYQKGKSFMDITTSKNAGDVRTRLQLHNNEVGRRVSTT